MQELLSKLDYNDRVVLLNELKESFDKEEKVKVAKEKVVKSMPITEIYRVCFFHACPYFVFGVLDNTIMLVFGDIIEEQIARTCGKWNMGPLNQAAKSFATKDSPRWLPRDWEILLPM